jgi:hypothetical protein
MVAEHNFSSRSGKPCATGVGFNLTQNSIIQRTSHIGFNGISTIRALTTTMITLTITMTIKVIQNNTNAFQLNSCHANGNVTLQVSVMTGKYLQGNVMTNYSTTYRTMCMS